MLQEASKILITKKMDDIFDAYLGFHDDQLANTIWELIKNSESPSDLQNILQNASSETQFITNGGVVKYVNPVSSESETNHFDLPEELLLDMWTFVDDHRNGRLDKILRAEPETSETEEI
ncbi:unnamed protein product [Gongylonema pulchrum]|uniref:CdiI_2 domain-containing protein n=1 Tax=Gongylonema pulchrum TaxID=637853 RepID=A0A183DL17_9BILA|nr:unnamed protein product [Gongylonema pulchrum]